MTVIPHPPYSPDSVLQLLSLHNTQYGIQQKETSWHPNSSRLTARTCQFLKNSPHKVMWLMAVTELLYQVQHGQLSRGQHTLTRNVVIPKQIHSRNNLITPQLQPTPQHALTPAMLVQWHTDRTPCYDKTAMIVQSYETHMAIFHCMYTSFSLPWWFSCNFSFAHQFIILHNNTNALSLVMR